MRTAHPQDLGHYFLPRSTVMAGLDPAIHEKKRVDHRVKPGDDERM
jgi:hypothetical protein